MNRTSGVLIVILSVLCVALAINTVVQARSGTPALPDEEPREVDPTAGAVPQTGTAALEEVSFEEIEAPPDAAPLGFVGEWLNEEADLGSLTRITVTKVDSGLTIQPWGASPKGERPYGAPLELAADTNPAEFTWDAGFAQQRLRLAVMPDGVLRVDRIAECMNHSCGVPQPVTTETFYKATQEDLAAHAGAIAEAEATCVPAAPGGG